MSGKKPPLVANTQPPKHRRALRRELVQALVLAGWSVERIHSVLGNKHLRSTQALVLSVGQEEMRAARHARPTALQGAAHAKGPDATQSAAPTLAALFGWYDTAILHTCTPRTQSAYRSTFRLTLERFGHHAQPTRSALYAWLSERVQRGQLTPSSANTLRAHLHAVYARAREVQWPQLLNPATFSRFAEPPQVVHAVRPLGGHRWVDTTQRYAKALLGRSRRKGGS